jgi:hypothetical protein
MTLSIELQEGFQNDNIIILINGKGVYARENITTRTQIGLADKFEINVDEDRAAVEIKLPARNLTETVEIILNKKKYLGFSVVGKENIKHIVQEEEFRYM